MAKLALLAAAMAGALALASAQYAPAGYNAGLAGYGAAAPVATAVPIAAAADPLASYGGAATAAAPGAYSPLVDPTAGDAPNVSGAYPNVYAALQGEGLTDFQTLADRGRLSPLLKNASIPSTVFVPSNQAVAQALADMKMDAQAIASNGSVITDIVFYHIVPGRVFSEGDLQQMGAMGPAGGAAILPTMRGKDLIASTSPSTGAVEVVGGTEARLVPGRTNIRAGNSTIHVIDYLLLPEDTRDEAGLKTRAVSKRFGSVAEALARSPQFASTARAAASDPPLAGVLSNPQLVATVFAPNNAAWNALAKVSSPILNNATMLRDAVAYGVATNRALSQDELRALGPGSTLSTLSGAPLIVGQMSSAASAALTGSGDARPVAQEAGELLNGMPSGSAALMMMSSDSGSQSVGIVGEPIIAGRSIVHETDGVLIPKAVAQQVAAIEAKKAAAVAAVKAQAAQAAALAAANATAAAKAKNGAVVGGVSAALVGPAAAAAVFAALL